MKLLLLVLAGLSLGPPVGGKFVGVKPNQVMVTANIPAAGNWTVCHNIDKAPRAPWSASLEAGGKSFVIKADAAVTKGCNKVTMPNPGPVKLISAARFAKPITAFITIEQG